MHFDFCDRSIKYAHTRTSTLFQHTIFPTCPLPNWGGGGDSGLTVVFKVAFWHNFPFLTHIRKVNVHHDRYLLISILSILPHVSLCGVIGYLIKYKFATNNGPGVSQKSIYFYHRNSPVNVSKRWGKLKGGSTYPR